MQHILKFEHSYDHYISILLNSLGRDVWGEERKLYIDEQSEIVLNYFIAWAKKGDKKWHKFEPGIPIPAGAKIRMLAYPEQDCFTLMVIECIAQDGTCVETTVIGPKGNVKAGTLMLTGKWEHLHGRYALYETMPARIKKWNVGIVTSLDENDILRKIEQLSDRSSTLDWRDDNVMKKRKITLPLATCKAFSLDYPFTAEEIEGRGELIAWNCVEFV
jgi:hypothetical protein